MPYATTDVEERRRLGREKSRRHRERMISTQEGLIAFRAKHAEVQRKYCVENREAYLASQQRYSDKVKISRPIRAKVAPSPFVDHKYSDDLYARIHKLVPKHIDKDRRDDIIADIYIGVLEGAEFTAEYVKLYVKQYNKQFSQYDTVSLDAVMAGGQSRGQIMGVY